MIFLAGWKKTRPQSFQTEALPCRGDGTLARSRCRFCVRKATVWPAAWPLLPHVDTTGGATEAALLRLDADSIAQVDSD